MKKTLKIAGITLGSIVGVIIIVAIIACYVVFTPERLTPIVRNNADRFITCESQFDTINLTFFSTFPKFVLHANNIQLINKIEGAQSDTLLSVEDLAASVDLGEFIFHDNIKLDKLYLKNGYANIYSDSIGMTNYDIVVASEKEEKEDDDDDDNSSLFNLIDLQGIEIDNITATYIDKKGGIDATINNFQTQLNGQLQEANADINANIQLDGIVFTMHDSTTITAQIKNISFKTDGELRDNHFVGEIGLELPQTTFAMNNDTMLNAQSLKINAPLEFNFDIMHLNLKGATIALNENEIALDGPLQLMDNDDINLDINAESNAWIIERITKLIPKQYASILDDFKQLNGELTFALNINGTYNKTTMPTLDATLNLDKGTINYVSLPYTLHNLNTSITAHLDLNDSTLTNATINSLHAETGTMSLDLTGKATDLMGNPNINASIKGNINLSELKPLLPNDLKVDMRGRTKLDLTAQFTLDDILKQRIEGIQANGTMAYSNLDVKYNDSIFINDKQGNIGITLPSPHSNDRFKELLQTTIVANDLQFEMLGTVKTKIKSPNLTIGIGEFRDSTQFYAANCQFDIAQLQGAMDTINFNIEHPAGKVILCPSKRNKKNPAIGVFYDSKAIIANLGNALNVNTKNISIEAFTAYDKSATTLLQQWNPTVKVDFNNGNIKMKEMVSDIKIPSIKFKFRPNIFDIEKSRIVIEESDFNLSGRITNLKEYTEGNGLLKGDLAFESKRTNIDQLMNIINGFGSEGGEESEEDKNSDENYDYAKSATQTASISEEEKEEANPFMVPKGVDIRLNTNISEAIFNDNQIDKVKGALTIKDGVAVVEQMGFTCDAAEMQLTGVYRSDRRNHLFCGLDFHLLNIDIKRLIEMIPSVDTIVPMLKTFAGKAQFHIAAETYLRADYSPKMSTMRAAAAIEGKELILMDNELFSTISKYMMFNKKTQNLVDSLSVEMTVFRNEVDIYPFLVSMDKWQAVLSGRHNLDMSFNYHISLTDCPLPVRLGLDVKGTFDDMKFDLVPCKYKALYKPGKQKATDKQTLALKKIISDSLKKNVK